MNRKPNLYNSNKELLNSLKEEIIDPLAKEMINNVKWLEINGFSEGKTDLYPVTIIGEGEPLLMLHGFDSCFLEYRRLIPLLRNKNKLIIPDLYGFGFCPRPNRDNYGLKFIINFLNQLLRELNYNSQIGLIGASMGGAIAMELARHNPEKFCKLLLLSPAGLTGKEIKVPWPINHIGACILSNRFIRTNLCKQAFSNPSKSVGPAEEQIASIHLKVPGWHRSLASFAKNGGVANCGAPIPTLPIHAVWGKNDRIIPKSDKDLSINLLGANNEEIENCGHLPHLETPELIAKSWIKN